MNLKKKFPILVLLFLALPGTAAATNTVLSGIFDGSEQETGALPGTCPQATTLGYQRINNVQVTSSGTYTVADAFNIIGADVTALIYTGNFNPGAPLNNLLTPGGIDVFEAVNLTSGTNYVLVVQHWCENQEGAWALTFSGPGSINSAAAVMTPGFTEGEFTGSEPVSNSGCGDAPYQEYGPIQVSRTGSYYYTDISINTVPDAVDTCVQIYDAPFSPGNPNANRVGFLDDLGIVQLETGQDYYFVVQPLVAFGPSEGEYFFVLAPPAPFRITHAMAGGWYDPPTTGQGFVMDVFENRQEMFLAWFTYDLERPDPSAEAMIGDPGHRWLTAQGPYDGDTAELPVYWTSGGVFDSPQPATNSIQDGSITVQFFDCLTGMVTYDLGTVNVSGQLPIQRLANDAEQLCDELTSAPGQPGPL